MLRKALTGPGCNWWRAWLSDSVVGVVSGSSYNEGVECKTSPLSGVTRLACRAALAGHDRLQDLGVARGEALPAKLGLRKAQGILAATPQQGAIVRIALYGARECLRGD